MTQVTDRVALPIRVHDLLLGLAGRLDDDALGEARELLASTEVDRALELIAGCLNAGRISLASAERTELRALFAEAHLDSLLVEHVQLGQSCYRHRFHQGPGNNRADHGVADAIRKVLGALPDVRAVWAVWRTTPAGSVAGPVPHRVVLVEVGSRGRPPATAYRIEHALRRVGIRASVEVLRDGIQMSDYHRQAMESSCRVAVEATAPSTGSQPAPPPQSSRPSQPHQAPRQPVQQQVSQQQVSQQQVSQQPPQAPQHPASQQASAAQQPAPPQTVAPAQEQPRRSSWRERRAAAAEESAAPSWSGDGMSDLEQSEPVTPRTSGSYPVRSWQDSGVHQRPPEAAQAQPVDILGDDAAKHETTGVIDAIPAGPALASVEEERPAQPQEPKQLPARPERPDFQRRRAFGQRESNGEPDPGIRAVPPVQPMNSARAATNESELNDQEQDLLRQLQEELAKRERTEESDSSQWRADRSGRHSDGQASWAGGRSRQVNGVPPGSSGGGDQGFPPGA